MAIASQLKHGYASRRLSHLNFDYITLLLKKYIMTGLPKLKYVKDQLCSSYEMSKAKRSSFKLKVVPSSKGRLNLLHMDLYGPIRVASINGKKYILSKGYVFTTRETRLIVEVHSSSSSDQNHKKCCLMNKHFRPRTIMDKRCPVKMSLQARSTRTKGRQIVDKLRPVPPRQGLEFLFSPLLEEYYNPAHGHAEDDNNDQAPNASFQEDEFINPFCNRVQEIGESSSHNIDNTDVHSFQPQSHDYRWTRDHLLEQVHGNLTMPVQTRRQLATDPEMCISALTMSIVESKNIKEAMADSAWIEEMQDELHQFDRLKV
ncbi:hypothetical protein Tco_0447925 [Tanacetum coccineum]